MIVSSKYAAVNQVEYRHTDKTKPYELGSVALTESQGAESSEENMMATVRKAARNPCSEAAPPLRLLRWMIRAFPPLLG